MQFELAPISVAVTIALTSIAALFFGLALLTGWIAWSTSSAPVSVEAGAMRLSVPFYGRTIPLASVDVAGIRIVDLDAASALRPAIRTNGIGLPGYSVGWFRLNDGSRALLAVTSRKQVVHIPTAEGYSVLISPRDPQAMVDRLRAEAGAD